MPYIVTGEPTSWASASYSKMNFNYTYPDGLNLKPDSELHNKLRSRIWERAQMSRNEIQKRFSYWREIDRTLTTYVVLKDKEEDLQSLDPSKPVSIVFPYSYSMLESLLTYLSAAFFQDPIFQYVGVEDGDTVNAMLLELVIKLHCAKYKVALTLHTMMRDALCYGIGIVVPEWQRSYGRKATGTGGFVDSLLFEGNSLSNVDPYMWLPDPSVASHNIQKGEFVGWIDRDNYMNLLSEEVEPNSGRFNCRYLKDKVNKRSIFAFDESERQTRHGGSTQLEQSLSAVTSPVDVIKMYINLIPKDWELGPSEYPEKWYFELAADDVIIVAEKASHNHGMYPMAVASPEFDGYSPVPIGRMEILYGLQHTLDFLFNSHIENVRKAINDMLIVDPYLININDLKDPKPGKLVRLRRPAWGRGVDKVVQQLAVNDITRANIADSSYITQWMDRISGADQSMQGALRQGGPERLSSAEFQGTRSSAISRLQRLAMIIGLQAFQDIGTMFASHTQQYMTQSAYVQVAGQYAEQLTEVFGQKGSIKVDPSQLRINYDILVRDGSIPGGNFSSAWLDLFKTIGTNPELMQQFDVTRIFTYIARQLGAKNVEDFRRSISQIQPKVLPDAQVQSMAQQGNLMPLGEM